MSKINCDSCDNLRENAPEFVQNGVTENICTSLQNNTGLNPSLSTLHNDAQDMHDVNDCTIGRMAQELEAYDVCDWKEYMRKLVPNLYEYNKANNCVDAGQWEQIEALNDNAELLCKSIDNLLSLIRGNSPKHHYGTFAQIIKNNVRLVTQPGNPHMPSHDYFKPVFAADILDGAGCNEAKKLGRYHLTWAYDYNISPYSVSLIVDTAIPTDSFIGTIPKSAVNIGTDITEDMWKRTCAYPNIWRFGSIGNQLLYITAKGYTVYNGIVFNENLISYGEDVLCLFWGPVIGNNELPTGNFNGNFTREIRSYDA